jgi:hypothetical protein
MSEQQGWIKLYRKFVDWEWYTDSATKDLFLHLLLTANHTEKKWRGETINKGELVTSISSLSVGCGLSEQQVRTALGKLEKTGEIKRKATNKHTLIIVVNYGLYQGMEYGEQQTNNTPHNNQTTNEQQTNNNQITTNKNDKNVKNVKNERKRENHKNININKNRYGKFQNVELTDDEYNKVKNKGMLDVLEELSEGIESKGYKYKSHYATILVWARNKKPKGKLETKPTYDLEQIKRDAMENVEI